MIEVKTLGQKEIKENEKRILNFYVPKYKHQFTETTLTNSAVVCLAFEDNEIVGAVRSISDMTRHALIVDMIVDEKYRNKKIGTQLLRAIVAELKSYNVKNVGLTTEPEIPWLIDFYTKNGFEPLSNGSMYLELKS